MLDRRKSKEVESTDWQPKDIVIRLLNIHGLPMCEKEYNCTVCDAAREIQKLRAEIKKTEIPTRIARAKDSWQELTQEIERD